MTLIYIVAESIIKNDITQITSTPKTLLKDESHAIMTS